MIAIDIHFQLLDVAKMLIVHIQCLLELVVALYPGRVGGEKWLGRIVDNRFDLQDPQEATPLTITLIFRKIVMYT